MSGARPRRDLMRLPMLAGWLFVDLLLVLFLAGLGALPGAGKPAATPRPTPRPSTPRPTTAVTTPPVTEPPKQRVLEREPYEFTVHVPLLKLDARDPDSPAARRLVSEVNVRLKRLARLHPELAGRDVGFVLALGAGSNDNKGPSIEKALQAIEILRGRHDRFDQAADVGRGYWTEGRPTSIEFVVLFYSK